MIHQTIYLREGRRDVRLSAYVLEDSRELLRGKKRPGILICPGGGYLTCSDREAEPVALRFAAMGYHAFVLRYSTYSGEANQFPMGEKLKKNERSLFPNAMQDIGRAFLAFHEHAEEWLLDTRRIALCGFSAGAHNCAMYAVSWQGSDIAGFFGGEAERFRPAACILAYGLFDYHMIMEQKKDLKNPFSVILREASCMALLGTNNPGKALLDRVSPARLLSEDFPPAFLWTTGEDSLVPPAQTMNMALALAQKGLPFECHLFESGPHGLSLASQATAGSRFEVDEPSQAWIIMAETWLFKRFELPLNEKPYWMTDLETHDAPSAGAQP